MAIRFLLLLFIGSAFKHPCLAQEKISLAEIEKINISEGAAGMMAGYVKKYELLNENGKWNCYQVSHTITGRLEQKTDLQRKFIRTAEPEKLIGFLTSISDTKPFLDWKDFHITPQSLKITLIRVGI